MALVALHTSAPSVAKATTTEESVKNASYKQSTEKYRYKGQIVWRNVIICIYLHTAAVYGMYLSFFCCKWSTFWWAFLVGLYSSQGITAGAHRLWAHRCYKARLPLRIIFMIAQTIAYQNSIYTWVRDHRTHHKFVDTDADPHNAKRGFFFSHVGWLLVRRHNDVIIKGRTIEMSDIEADPVVTFQRRYYRILMPLFCFVIPAFVPWYYFNESLWTSWHVASIYRYVLSVNCTWLVNSAAHIWGTKPYDKTIGPTENRCVSFCATGEGWHNYHHVFPWDYKAAELGNYRLNLTTMIIDFFYKIGWAYDLKTVSVDMIKKRARRTGDGTRKFNEGNETESECTYDDYFMQEGIWGWGDKDMYPEIIREATVYNKI